MHLGGARRRNGMDVIDGAHRKSDNALQTGLSICAGLSEHNSVTALIVTHITFRHLSLLFPLTECPPAAYLSSVITREVPSEGPTQEMQNLQLGQKKSHAITFIFTFIVPAVTLLIDTTYLFINKCIHSKNMNNQT